MEKNNMETPNSPEEHEGLIGSVRSKIGKVFRNRKVGKRVSILEDFSEKIEEIENNLSVGDVLVSNSGTRRKVVEIDRAKDLLVTARVDEEGNEIKPPSEKPYSRLLDKANAIDHIEKAS